MFPIFFWAILLPFVRVLEVVLSIFTFFWLHKCSNAIFSVCLCSAFLYSDLKLVCASPLQWLWYHDQTFQMSIIINESQYNRVRFSIYPTVPYVWLPFWFVFTEGPSINATIKRMRTLCVFPRGWTSSHLLLFSHSLYVTLHFSFNSFFFN